ncbi:Acid-resistant protein [Minicystis rosea]|nr:Acid-resistant protein [Minicystis rosea]
MPNTDLLRSIPLFEGLAQEDLDHLANTLVERPFASGEMIFHQGDAGTEMYIVASGHVNIHLPGESSRRVSLKDITVGEYFGELALFDDKPRSASALATTDASLLELSRETLSAYLERRPRAAMAILRTMAERLRETNAMLSERAAKNVVEELDKQLTWSDRLADKVAEFNGSWGFIGLLLGISVMWFIMNRPGLLHGEPFDQYPYVFFNLVLAILVALQGPLIVMSQNRQVLKDRATAETDFKVNLKNEVNIETILRELGELRAEANARLESVEKSLGLTPFERPATSKPSSASRPVSTVAAKAGKSLPPPASTSK